ncbi:MAG: hypothetical protein CL942_09730 [Desulfovibrio sp.]|nr:hypothetical protein [Desulfovibrio sp.]MBC17315.1 hypothetical protein [Desulfovibrio sp.]|tara:strand:+ start:14395 stop:15174 length:780 start_codon:yes stop_codon:yes gene_type:complete
MIDDRFNPLLNELNLWTQSAKTAEFWWRDDDAAEPCVELDRLIELSERHAAPCGLATVPTRTGEALGRVVAESSHLWVLQHGYAHVNHAPKGNGAWELGLHRPESVVLSELRDGMRILSRLFGERFVPVVVPPWNKMDPALLPSLPGMGYRGASASYKSSRPTPPEGLRMADAHCDLLSWKDKAHGARFAGEEKCIRHLVDHLKNKRTGHADERELTCALTHHLEMDDAAWDFMDSLLSVISGHPASGWISPVDIWPAN